MSYSGLNERGENFMRMVNFDHPKWTPVWVGFLPRVQLLHGEAFDELRLRHPRIFPGFTKQTTANYQLGIQYRVGRFTDCWGCVWEGIIEGIVGQVVGHPLDNWANFATWRPPTPLKDGLLAPIDWAAIAKGYADKKSQGDAWPDWQLPHGFHYMLLCDLRGFANAMTDMLIEEPMLDKLIALIIDYNAQTVKKQLDLGSQFIGLAEDLGMQHSLPISHALWVKYVKPGYEATAGQARDRGLPVFLHSDGHILPIMDDLIETGIRLLNPQTRANGLQGLRDRARGKVAICLDLDRQLFPYATPEELKQHVYDAYNALSMPEGGFMFSVEIGDDVPIENAEALFCAIEDVCNLPDA